MTKKQLKTKKYFTKLATKKAAKINSMNYHKTYLSSAWWINRRKSYWNKHPKICFCCNDVATELHHNNYGFLYREQDKHLVPLCNDCHNEIHRLIKIDSDFDLQTAHIVYKKLLQYNEEFEYMFNHLDNI